MRGEQFYVKHDHIQNYKSGERLQQAKILTVVNRLISAKFIDLILLLTILF